LIDHIGGFRHLWFRSWKVREVSASPLRAHRVIEGLQTLAAGLSLKRLLLTELFDARSKINARLASAPLRRAFYLV
jgi:hypothetical protein